MTKKKNTSKSELRGLVKDAKLLKAITTQGTYTDQECLNRIREYWHDDDRAARTSVNHLFFHLGIACAIGEAAIRDRDLLEKGAQGAMQALGPDVPKVDYTNAGNLAGLLSDVGLALEALREIGIEFKRRVKHAEHGTAGPSE